MTATDDAVRSAAEKIVEAFETFYDDDIPRSELNAIADDTIRTALADALENSERYLFIKKLADDAQAKEEEDVFIFGVYSTEDKDVEFEPAIDAARAQGGEDG